MRCARHSGTETDLTCGRCGTAVCPRCLVHVEVGIRCPRCVPQPRRNILAIVLGWLVLFSLWRAIFKPKLLQRSLATLTGVVWLAFALSAVVAVVGGNQSTDNATLAPSVSGGSRDTASAQTSPPAILSGALDGVQINVTNVDRAWPQPTPNQSWPGQFFFATPDPSFHIVRLDVTFAVTQGEHEVDLGSINVKDSLGYQHAASPYYAEPCDFTSNRTFSLAAGGQLGPMPMCFEVGGPADGPPSLIWIPSNLPVGEAVIIQL
jgi:hypothetical protein